MRCCRGCCAVESRCHAARTAVSAPRRQRDMLRRFHTPLPCSAVVCVIICSRCWPGASPLAPTPRCPPPLCMQPREGIMPHEDGPLYHPAVAILSLGSPAVVRFARKHGEEDAAAAAAAAGALGRADLGGLVGCADTAPPYLPGSHVFWPRGIHTRASPGPPLCISADAAPAAEGAAPAHPLAGQLVASVACMPRSLLIFRCVRRRHGLEGKGKGRLVEVLVKLCCAAVCILRRPAHRYAPFSGFLGWKIKPGWHPCFSLMQGRGIHGVPARHTGSRSGEHR